MDSFTYIFQLQEEGWDQRCMSIHYSIDNYRKTCRVEVSFDTHLVVVVVSDLKACIFHHQQEGAQSTENRLGLRNNCIHHTLSKLLFPSYTWEVAHHFPTLELKPKLLLIFVNMKKRLRVTFISFLPKGLVKRKTYLKKEKYIFLAFPWFSLICSGSHRR